MKLLFDENLSPRLPGILAKEYPGSMHVRDVGLRGANDRQIWDYARAQGFAIVSKDTDFRERSFVEGFPPRSCGWTPAMREPAQSASCCGEQPRLEHFERQTEESLLILSIRSSVVRRGTRFPDDHPRAR